ncbi:MAG: SoxR reducing system RseC family protein [Woeseia sp.]
MNIPEGKVVAVGPNSATVSVEAAVACKRCAAGRGCGAGLLQKSRTRLIEVKMVPGVLLEVGDTVRLELPPADLLRAAWLAYGLPLVAMVMAVTAGAAFTAAAGDLPLVAFAALGLTGGVVLGRRVLRKSGCLGQMIPTAAERLKGNRPEAAGRRTDGHGGGALT